MSLLFVNTRVRSLYSLILATLADRLAHGIAGLVLPLVAVTVTDSPLLISGITLSLNVPWLICGLVSGIVVDRLDRRRLLMWVAIVRGISLLALCLVLLLGRESIGILYIVAVSLGVTATLLEPALIAVIPAVSPVHELDRANARIIGGGLIADNSAQAISGGLAAVGLALAAGAASIGFAISGVALFLMQGRFRTSQDCSARISQSSQSGVPRERSIAAGLKFILNTEPLRTITLISAIINGCWAAWWSVWVLYAVAPGPVGLSSFGLGIILSLGSLSSLIGTMSSLPIQRKWGRRWAIGLNVFGNGALFLISALSANVLLILLAIVCGEFGGPGWGIASNALQQRIVPDELRGRVASAYRFVGFGAKSVGAAVGGIAASQIGIPAVYAGCAVITLAMVIPFLRHVSDVAMMPPTIPDGRSHSIGT